MDENTIICRCEDLTLADIRAIIKKGFHNPQEIKRLTRCGMGPCQGSTCRELLLKEVASATGKSIGELEMTTFRPPTKPIKAKSILTGVNQDEI